MSDRQIAEHVGVGNWMVAKYRAVIIGKADDAPAIREVTGNGKTYEMTVSLPFPPGSIFSPCGDC